MTPRDLARLRDREVPVPSVAAAVMARVRGRERRRLALTWSIPAAIATAVMCVGVWVWPDQRLETMPVKQWAIAAPPVETPLAQPPVRRIPRAPVIQAKRVTHAQPVAESMTVKLMTDDPDVIVYWIVDGKGD